MEPRSPRSSGREAATSVACPWPYPDAKVFDPQGFYEKNGQQGPYLRRNLVDLDERPAGWTTERETASRRRTVRAATMGESRSVVVITAVSRGLASPRSSCINPIRLVEVPNARPCRSRTPVLRADGKARS